MSSSSYSSLPSSKMLKDFLMEDPPSNSSMFSSFETVLVKAFKAVVPRSRHGNTIKVQERDAEAKATSRAVKVRDIVRWSSFRDMAEDVPSGQYGSDCFAPSSVTGYASSSCNTSSSGGGSNGSSWCESDFSEEFSLAWRESGGKKHEGPIQSEGTTQGIFAMERKMVSSFCDEKEQPGSPVSVAGFRYAEDEDACIEYRFQEDEESSFHVEERARHLLNLVELTNSSPITLKPHVKRLLVDFFASELSREGMSEDDLEQEAVDTARRWIDGELHGDNEWGIGGRKDAYVTEMDEAGMWAGYEEREKMGMVLEVEKEVLDELVREVLVDCLLAC
ncbi:hypothetical protein MLD38_036472 [Melastoma candidum]|uniref:Uncharacterized protein n=1 Tax=Melastoma candidum TaxID=119954 RepID=A0ACB9LKS0_9MYRT|nr:hypothetical protein MLD38_036472 [Melastoma candidum]